MDLPQHSVIAVNEVVHATPLAPTSSAQDLDMSILPSIEHDLQYHYDSPLYTEINIPLPRLPTPNTLKSPEPRSTSTPSQTQTQTSSQTPRYRSRTLSSLLPFHRRPSSPSTPQDAEEWPRIRKDTVESKETHAMMDLAHHSKKSRRGTIDALAVVPTVLVLSAELFTPGSGGVREQGKRKDSGVGRWEDGIR